MRNLPAIPIEAVRAELCRRQFHRYRRAIHPGLIDGAWQVDLARKLEHFYQRMLCGDRPKLAICAPPQHGKSTTVIDFIAWVAGQRPTTKIIYASYSNTLGVNANTALERIINDQPHIDIFGPLIGEGKNTDTQIQFGRGGYFRNTTVMGSITGETLDLGIIDDPIKGRAEATSPTIRAKTWDWFTNDFMTRQSKNAGLLWIMTRWHLDDPLGRAIEIYPDLEVVKYPAINPDGTALFPELKPHDFLMERKKALLASHWEALYMQNPVNEAGRMFKTEEINILPRRPEVTRAVRYWDTAGTEGAGCYTAGVLMGVTEEKKYIVLDVVRGQWSRARREKIIRQTAELDGQGVEIYIERQPGSSGKEIVQDSIRNLAGFTAREDSPSGSKLLRAEPVSAQVENGNLSIVLGAWNKAYLDELELCPGPEMDQVDATSGAFAKLATREIWIF